MAILNIRNLPAEIHAALRIRAAKANRSMEAEARAILIAACGAEQSGSAASLQEWVADLYDGRLPGGVVDELIEDRRREAAAE